MPKKVLIIDNYDSFTHILKQYIGELKGNPEVFLNDQISIAQIQRMKPTHIVLSPGPGTVGRKRDRGIMFEVIEKFHKKVPILGVCLGHQALAKYFGARIIPAKEVMHGKRSNVFHLHQGIFRDVTNPMKAMRYHSLTIDPKMWLDSDEFDVTAYTGDFTVMGIQHKKHPLYGVQFHPESLGTKEGKLLLKNFLKTKV